VKNMAIGASLADVAILLISASVGEFEAGIMRGGMTREESIVAFANGVKQFVVLVNKMDSVKYSEARFEEVKKEVLSLLQKVGVDPTKTPVIPISAYIGDNLTEPSNKMPWFKNWTIGDKTGVTFYEAIDALSAPKRASELPLRVPILRAFKIGGVGTVAIGRVASGTLKKGQMISVMPNDLKTEATSVEIFHTDRTNVQCGDLVGIRLKNIAVKDVYRGMVISDQNNSPQRAAVRFTAQIVILNHGNVHQGFEPYFFCHTQTFSGRFVEIISKLDKRTGAVLEDHPKVVKTGDAALVVIEPRHPVCVEEFRSIPPLGRLILKDGFTFIAVGIVKSVEYSTGKPVKPVVKKLGKKFFK